RRRGRERPVRRAVRPGARGHHGGVPVRGPPVRRVRGPVAMESRSARVLVRVATGLTLAFLYIPLAIVFVYAFNPSRGQVWPPPGLTTRWFTLAWHNDEVRTALLNSLKAGLGATTIALVLGSAAAFAVNRF